jgi:hypothetical protein
LHTTSQFVSYIYESGYVEHQRGVKGAATGGGEDKERSGTGAALTPGSVRR